VAINGMHALHALAGLIQELERLAAAVRELEVRIAAAPAPGAEELLARLAGAAEHFEAARTALAGGPSAEADGAPLSGSSRTVPIQDLLSFLATTRKSGILRVEAEQEGFLLQLQEGAVVYAKGDAPPPGEGLSDLLAARGVPSPELLGQLPERAGGGSDSAWVDRSLLGTSWIGRDALAGALQQQTRLSFFRLCSARDTHFRFHEGAEIQNIVPVRHSAMELLLEHSRAVDEGRGPLVAHAAPVPRPVQRRPTR
jgi:hypothetical protein